jgi:hypothetical protein
MQGVAASMLELEQWNSALSSITGTLVRGTERVSTAHCLDLLDVGPDPVLRQRVGKRQIRPRPCRALDYPKLRPGRSLGRDDDSGNGRRMHLPPSPVDIVDESDATRTVPTKEPTNMLEPDQWDPALSSVDLIEQIDENQSVPTNESTNMLEPDQWNAVLSRVTGTVYRRTERISSNALLNLLEVGPDPVIRQKVGKRLVSQMRRLGWTGPRAMRIPAENGHAAGSSGYWRLPSRPLQPAVNVEGEVGAEVDSLADDLPAALEKVTRLGLKKLEKVLRVPLDPTDGNLVRSQVTAAIGAVNAQLRADEHQLKRKSRGDVLERLLKIIEKEKKIIEEKNSHRSNLPSMWNWNAAMPKPP